MPLISQQITDLSEVLDAEWNLPTLVTFVSDHLDIDLNKLAPSGSLKERAWKLIITLNGSFPPRDRELLDKLSVHGNARLKAFASALLAPTFYSPTGDPLHAIVLGRAAFVGRADLRQVITDFIAPTRFTTRVLIIHGNDPGGKSYSWGYIRHLAFSIGANPVRLRLKNSAYKPKELLEQVVLLLGLDPSGMPKMVDDPQLARVDPLINWLKGKLPTLTQAWWLVIDDLNDPSVTKEILETAYALAYCAEEAKQNLWCALLGYNEPIADPELRFIAKESACFPDVALVAKHFEDIAKLSPVPLTSTRAKELATLLFSKFSKIDKESMVKLTQWIENMGEKLILGQQP